MICKDCRKKEIDPTFTEKIALWVIKHLFPDTYCDIKADSFTQGFSEGYQEGFKRSDDLNKIEITKIIKLYDEEPRKNKKRTT